MGGSLGDTLDTRLDVRYLETTETDNRYQYQEQLSAPSRHMPVLEIRSVCPSCVDPGFTHFPRNDLCQLVECCCCLQPLLFSHFHFSRSSAVFHGAKTTPGPQEEC